MEDYQEFQFILVVDASVDLQPYLDAARSGTTPSAPPRMSPAAALAAQMRMMGLDLVEEVPTRAIGFVAAAARARGEEI